MFPQMWGAQSCAGMCFRECMEHSLAPKYASANVGSTVLRRNVLPQMYGAQSCTEMCFRKCGEHCLVPTGFLLRVPE